MMAHIFGWLHARLSRVTSSGRFVPQIDGLRFVAIMAVLLHHFHPKFFTSYAEQWSDGMGLINWLMFQGWFGVQLFFIVSGFILSLPFAEQHQGVGRKVRLRDYFVRRLTRLEPPYIVNMLIILAVVVFAGSDGPPAEALRNAWGHFLATLFYSHNFAYGDVSTISNITWSLEIEVQFYIVAPLLGCVFKLKDMRRRRAVLVAGILLSLALSAIPGLLKAPWEPFLHRTLAGQMRYFLLGFLLADIYVFSWHRQPKSSRRWDVVGLIAWLSLPALAAYRPSLEPWNEGHLACIVLLPWVLLVAYAAAFRGKLLRLVFANPLMTVVGGMCYTIYLYHIQLMTFIDPKLQYLFPHTKDQLGAVALLHALALTVTILGGCAVLFVLFEKPFMHRGWPQAAKARLQALLGRPVVGVAAAATIEPAAAGSDQSRQMPVEQTVS